MSFEPSQALPLLAVVSFIAFRVLRFRSAKKAIPELVRAGAVIVDVRTPREFQSGHHPSSINLPLDRFDSLCSSLRKETPVILCCASGTRSGIAAGILKARGFAKVLNAGPWTNTLT